MEKILKTWQKPQLIVLAKSTPEESVLTFCKTQNPNNQFNGESDQLQQDVCAGALKSCRNCQARANTGT